MEAGLNLMIVESQITTLKIYQMMLLEETIRMVNLQYINKETKNIHFEQNLIMHMYLYMKERVLLIQDLLLKK